MAHCKPDMPHLALTPQLCEGTEYVGLDPKTLELEFTLGTGEVEPGIELAVAGMGVGRKRRAVMREEIAKEIGGKLGGVQAGTRFAIELELVKSE